MTCPNCKSQTNKINLTDNYLQPFEIDQCQNCHGFWLDSRQIGKITLEEAERIDKNSWLPSVGGMKCPRCNVMLSEFRQPGQTAIHSFFACPECGGTFFLPGTLLAYKRKLEAKKIILGEKKVTPVQQARTALVVSLVFIFSLGLFLTFFSRQQWVATGGAFPLNWRDYLLLVLSLAVFILGGILVLKNKKVHNLIGWLSIILALVAVIVWIFL